MQLSIENDQILEIPIRLTKPRNILNIRKHFLGRLARATRDEQAMYNINLIGSSKSWLILKLVLF